MLGAQNKRPVLAGRLQEKREMKKFVDFRWCPLQRFPASPADANPITAFASSRSCGSRTYALAIPIDVATLIGFG